MQTVRSLTAALFVAMILFGAGRASLGQETGQELGQETDTDADANADAKREDPAATVKAQRYQTEVYASALDYSHRMGQKIVELYFPESGIIANLAAAPMAAIEMNAFYGEPRFDILPESARKLLGDKAPPRIEPEEIEVPRELYERIKALADITKRRAELAVAVKAEAEKSGLFVIAD